MTKKLFLITLISLLLAGCTAGSVVDTFQSTTTNNLKNMMTITSPAFKNGDPLSQDYTCDGAGTNPPNYAYPQSGNDMYPGGRVFANDQGMPMVDENNVIYTDGEY